jgi:hypothetical protein
VSRGKALPPRRAAQLVREMLHGMLTREIDECLLVNGKRMFDPYRSRRRRARGPNAERTR